MKIYAPVAQLDRVPDSDSEGHGFKSCSARQSRASTRRRVVEVLLFYSFFSCVKAASFLLHRYMSEQALYRLLRFSTKIRARSRRSSSFPQKVTLGSPARLPALRRSVNALAAVCCRCQLFAGSNPHRNFMSASFLLPLAINKCSEHRSCWGRVRIFLDIDYPNCNSLSQKPTNHRWKSLCRCILPKNERTGYETANRYSARRCSLCPTELRRRI